MRSWTLENCYKIDKIIQESVAVYDINRGTHTFALEVAEGLPPVSVDDVHLRQVLSNLLSNAVKFSPNGGTITTGARLHDHSILVWVADQGIGIPPEATAKLFSKFYRVDNADTRNIGGTGLGLALIKEFINAHGGRVWVESQQGKGSTFYFTLPLAAQPSPCPRPESDEMSTPTDSGDLG